jgi:hypothetical protein
MTYTIAVCTVKNSWWLTEELSETCRVSFQNNKMEKLVHLVGFIAWNVTGASYTKHSVVTRTTAIVWAVRKAIVRIGNRNWNRQLTTDRIYRKGANRLYSFFPDPQIECRNGSFGYVRRQMPAGSCLGMICSRWTCSIPHYETWLSFSSWFSICEQAGSDGNAPGMYFARTRFQTWRRLQPSSDVPGFPQSLQGYFVIL